MKIFNFFKRKKIEEVETNSVSFDLELTAAVLAYEIARIDGEIDENELKILMNELVLIANKTSKDESEILEIIESYSKNSVSFHDL